MTSPGYSSTPHAALRLWPAAAILIPMWLLRLGVPVFAPDAVIFEIPLAIIAMLSGVVGGLGVVIWWLFFSRAPWMERLGGVALMVVALVATAWVVHPSIAGGMMGFMLPFIGMPVLASALAIGAVMSRRLSTGARRVTMAVAIVLASGALAVVRTDGVTGAGDAELRWRWTPTAEQRLLAEAGVQTPPAPVSAVPSEAVAPPAVTPEKPAVAPDRTPAPPATASTPTGDARRAAGETWPGFRGPHRDGIVSETHIDTDWATSPPVALWRRAIGPGWSSFAVQGDRIYTQEQRGEDEIVSCYRLSTGEPVWQHRDAIRFYESNAGAGPRATPTVHGGRVFSNGATGVVNALDASTGARLWSRNAAADTGVAVPEWGVASSPLALDDLVVVAISGRLIAYDLATGEPRWMGPEGGAGYSSPQRVTIDGIVQILLARGSRTVSVSPADGRVLWEHSSGQPGVSIVQPAATANGTFLLAAGDAMGGTGIRRIAVAHDEDGWTVEERWASRGLKPYFSDFVVHKGHAYGFDGNILSAIGLVDGERAWKGGRYGSGQLMLLADQDLLLVSAEEGDLALVSATPDKFTEIARVPALNGKTWNHPVLVGDILLMRNGEEMAAFRLAVDKSGTDARP